jgi:hypothetical protein
MHNRDTSGITGIDVLIPTPTTVVSYRLTEGHDGWQIQGPRGNTLERAATVERALSVAACLSTRGQDAACEPFAG